MIAAKGLQIAQVKSRHHYALTDTLLLTERVIKRIVQVTLVIVQSQRLLSQPM